MIKDKSAIQGRYLLALYEGDSKQSAALKAGVNYHTVLAWESRDPKFKESVQRIQESSAKELIEKNLRRLAEGYDYVEKKEEFVDPTTGHNVTLTFKNVPPSAKAIELLANKYAKGEYGIADERNTINILIDASRQSLTWEDRMKILEQDAAINSTAETIKVEDI